MLSEERFEQLEFVHAQTVCQPGFTLKLKLYPVLPHHFIALLRDIYVDHRVMLAMVQENRRLVFKAHVDRLPVKVAAQSAT